MSESVPVSVLLIECPNCEAEIPRPPKAMTATCPNCGKSVTLDNRVLNSRYVFGGEILTRGTIFVGPKGFVKANLSATEVIIEGSVEGNIKAVEKLNMGKTGTFTGNATAKKLVVAEGASLQGFLNIGQPKNAQSPSENKA